MGDDGMGEEGMREGRGEDGREGGRKGKRKGGRNCYALWGPSVHALITHGGAGACARSSQLVLLLLCPRRLMVVGAIAVWSLSWAVRRGRGRLLLLPGSVSWALMVVGGCLLPWAGVGMASSSWFVDTDENISPVENPIFAILTKIHL